MSPLRAVVAEDQALFRSGLVRILEADEIAVVGAVSSGPDAENAVREHRPDVVILDVRMPPSYTDEGFRVARRLRAETAGLPVLILSQYLEQSHVRDLMADGAGAIGYLLKDQVMQVKEFVDAVRRVVSGGIAIDPDVMAGLLAEEHDPLRSVTEREQAVISLMAEGWTNTAIARRLAVSERTVGKCVNSLFARLRLVRSEDSDRRVLAVLAHLQRRPRST